ncbi:putative HTH-type transcriptional regulator YbbH [Lentibacillus sp. JNUCC-1]|uniref:MurR/RpiR family transcriptional regulator n=1 Tax=Lentibacillus sp. JNUCC-1 TaxID=2654513 RepID=UPI0012E760AF|nr:MurR/RpiR family transcriptional regulator [Lentibacillus sp. JNUCC-1]MUV39020.1 putative HTH-type transcriptional regulator YbbH [Lentibacillus sp. JNUCC-1]
MTTTGGILILTEMLPKLPPSEKKIASYIIEHPQESISLTANELGKRSSTSGAAVIRLCKSLNLQGFQDLKLRIAGDLQKPDDYVGYQDIQPNETASSIIKKMTDNTVQTIRETAELLNTEQLQKAVDVLRVSRRIHFIGVGASSIAAEDAQQKFLRIDKTAHAFKDMHMAATLVANASDKDVVVGISFSGETPEIAKILQLANENNAATISLTKYGKSTVVDHADINLFTSATSEPTFRSGATSSRIAQLQVVDILFMCVASLQYEETVRHLGATRDAVDFLTLNGKKG